MSNGMMVRLTRTSGTPISINAGIIASCEEMDGHTVIVTVGDDGDVYHVREKKIDVERLINGFLEQMIAVRLQRMEADPRWVRVFRQAVETLADTPGMLSDKERILRDLYKKIASAYTQAFGEPPDKPKDDEYYIKQSELYKRVKHMKEMYEQYSRETSGLNEAMTGTQIKQVYIDPIKKPVKPYYYGSAVYFDPNSESYKVNIDKEVEEQRKRLKDSIRLKKWED